MIPQCCRQELLRLWCAAQHILVSLHIFTSGVHTSLVAVPTSSFHLCSALSSQDHDTFLLSSLVSLVQYTPLDEVDLAIWPLYFARQLLPFSNAEQHDVATCSASQDVWHN